MKTLISASVMTFALAMGPAAVAQDMGGMPGVAAAAAHGHNVSNATGTAAYGASQYRTDYTFGDLLTRVSQSMAEKLDALVGEPKTAAEREEAAEEEMSVTAL